MKKLILIFFLLASVVQADEYIDSVTEVHDLVRINLNLYHTNPSATDSVINSYIYEAAMVLNSFSKGKLLVDTVIGSANNYIFAYDTLLISISSVDFIQTDTIKPLQWMDKSLWPSISVEADLLNDNEQTGIMKHSSYYDWEIPYLFVYPQAIAADTFIVVGYAKTSNVLSNLTSVGEISVTHRPGISYYATSMLALRLGRLPEAQAWEAKYDKYVAAIIASRTKRRFNEE